MFFVSEATIKKAKSRRKPKKAAPFEEVASGIVCRTPLKKTDEPWATKIIFLGNQNLEKLRGYKAYLDLWPDKLRLTITGLSRESARFHFPLF